MPCCLVPVAGKGDDAGSNLCTTNNNRDNTSNNASRTSQRTTPSYFTYLAVVVLHVELPQVGLVG